MQFLWKTYQFAKLGKLRRVSYKKNCVCLSSVFLLTDRELTIILGGFPTIADYYVATVLVQLEWINFGLELWPKISAWLSILKGMQQWKEVHEKHCGFVAELQKHDV